MANFEEIDLTLAIQLQAQFKEELRNRLKKEDKESSNKYKTEGYKWSVSQKHQPEPQQEKLSVSLVDPSWELLDPNPNIHDLFLTFNDQFFWGRLSGIEVKWSPRMTLCAGVCSYERRGGLCSVRLSTPLLKLRPRKDLIETLLHEMIHAYLFITDNNTDHDGHGEQFHKHMYRINGVAGTKISVYHSFHDEVNVYRQHVWQCSGVCRKRPPYYGLVKRSMNRPPSARDPWWDRHKTSCGGSYVKIKEPEGYGTKNKKMKKGDSISSTSSDSGGRDIRGFFSPAVENKKSSVKRNIKGFEASKTTGGMPVNHTGVGNKKNIFGFNSDSGSNGKPSYKSSAKTKDLLTGGSKDINPTIRGTKNPSKGAGLATGISSRSTSTVIVKKKTTTGADREEHLTSSEVGQQPQCFVGNGYTLGSSSGSGVSRLLSLHTSNNEINPAKSRDKTPNNNNFYNLSNQDIEPMSQEPESCPICNNKIAKGTFDEHISECIGDDLNDDSEDEQDYIPVLHDTKTTSKIPFYSSDTTINNYKSLANDCRSEDVVVIKENVGSSSLPIIIDSPKRFQEELFDCPICHKRFPKDKIDNHASSHFY